MEIKRSSWLYKLVVRKSWREDDYGDVCSLVRSALANVFVVTVISVIVLAFAGLAFYAVGDFIAWAIASIAIGELITPDGGAQGFMLLAACSAAVALLFGAGYLCAQTSKNGGVRAVYGAVTGKFCTRVAFKD